MYGNLRESYRKSTRESKATDVTRCEHPSMKEKGATAMLLKHVSGDGYSPQDFIANHADSITQNWSSTTSATTYVSGGAALGLGASSCHS